MICEPLQQFVLIQLLRTRIAMNIVKLMTLNIYFAQASRGREKKLTPFLMPHGIT
jgi:hypothetical protein